MSFVISPIVPGSAAMAALLAREGIRPDRNLEFSLGAFDEAGRLIGTGSAFGDTLRCLAVDAARQGEGVLSALVSELTAREAARGRFHLLVCAKWAAREKFAALGFAPVAEVAGECALMENTPGAFERYLDNLAGEGKDRAACANVGDACANVCDACANAASGTAGAGSGPYAASGAAGAGCGTAAAAAVVMNANPFTLGHRHLVEAAARECGGAHVFLVSEDASRFPAAARLRMARAGLAGLPGVTLRETGGYLISTATFPSYFAPDDDAATRAQARLDARVFARIAKRLGITARFLGEEPLSRVTAIYNEVLERELPKAGVAVRIVPRLEIGGEPVSAGRVRAAVEAGDWDTVKRLVPEGVYEELRGVRG